MLQNIKVVLHLPTQTKKRGYKHLKRNVNAEKERKKPSVCLLTFKYPLPKQVQASLHMSTVEGCFSQQNFYLDLTSTISISM